MANEQKDPRSSDAVVRRGLRVHGRVQGVGFRWWASQVAEDLELCGSIRNLGDGSVEAHVRGEPALLDRFEQTLRRGPPLARVDRVEVVEADEALASGPFRIER